MYQSKQLARMDSLNRHACIWKWHRQETLTVNYFRLCCCYVTVT